jgi:hypothetical protein
LLCVLRLGRKGTKQGFNYPLQKELNIHHISMLIVYDCCALY